MSNSSSCSHTIGRTARTLALALGLCVLAACGDAPSAPRLMDSNAIGRVMPSVIDARMRLARGLENAALRQALSQDIHELERALAANNAITARHSVASIADRVVHARSSASNANDAHDLSAIELMLQLVAPVVHTTVAEITFRASS